MKAKLCVARAVDCTWLLAMLLAIPVLANAQTASDSAVEPSSANQNKSCSVWALQIADSLTLKQRACYFARPFLSPQLAVSTAAFAALDQYRNSPWQPHERWSKFPHRVETFYARHASRDAAEFLVGYLHHEDPRLHKSTASGFWQRADSALVSVVNSPDADGRFRPALAPMAGSLSSAFVGTMMYRHSETLPTILTRAAGVYGFYFVRAVFAEFRPDILSVVHKLWN